MIFAAVLNAKLRLDKSLMSPTNLLGDWPFRAVCVRFRGDAVIRDVLTLVFWRAQPAALHNIFARRAACSTRLTMNFA
jgi:hypothetical protein